MNEARRSLFAMYKRIKNQSISIELQLRLFDSIVEPILLYGSEVWGFENTIYIEWIHIQFCKNILHLRKSTPNYMVYGELGLFPLSINIKMRMVGFWNRLVSNEHKFSSHLYRLMLSLHNSGVHEFKRIKSIQNIFNNTGLHYIFSFQGGIPFISYKLFLKQQLQDQFIQMWFSDVMNSSRGKCYSIFKKELELEKYLLRLPSHCSVWITNDVISDFRKKFIPGYYCKNANVQKKGGMSSNCHIQLLTNVAIVIKKICKLLYNCIPYSLSYMLYHRIPCSLSYMLYYRIPCSLS